MFKPSHIAALDALELPKEGGAPEWVHLLPPAGKPFTTIDGRGPWHYDSAETLIAASFAGNGPKLFIDVNHSTLRQGPKGGDAPAYGDIVEMQAREDGIWGRVEWSALGAEMMGERAYRGFSPVLLFDPNDKTKVDRIWHGSLTNFPALMGQLATLTSEVSEMDFSDIAKALGLSEDAGKDAILAAIKKLKGTDKPAELTALAEALGAEPDTGVAELTVLAASLQEQVGQAGTVEELSAQIKTMKAEAFIDAQMAAGVGIPANMRDEMVAMHVEDPERAQKMIGMLPNLGRTHTTDTPPDSGGKVEALTAEQKAVAVQLGLSEEDMLTSLNEEGGA